MTYSPEHRKLQQDYQRRCELWEMGVTVAVAIIIAGVTAILWLL